MKRTLNLAHRGFSQEYPENTMLAFQKAVEAGCDGIETDVQLTKDGQLVLCHDEELDRTTTGTGFIKDFTLEELLKLDAGIKFNPKFKGLTIPTLDEFLNYVKNKDLYINLEIKNSIIHYKDIEEKVYEKIYEYNMENKVIVSSFDHYSIRKCIRLNRNIKTGLLYGDCLFEPHNYVQMVGANALHPEFNSITKEIVDKAHDNNLEVNIYTVNSEEDMLQMINLGVDAIITNNPVRLNNILSCSSLSYA